MTDQVPPSAITADVASLLSAAIAAYEPQAAASLNRDPSRSLLSVLLEAARRAVEAASPAIKAAEREQLSLILVWRDERKREICRSTPLRPGTRRIAIPLDAEHADLLAGEL